MVGRLKPSFFARTMLVGRHVPQYSFLLVIGGLMKSEVFSKINVPGEQYIAAAFQGIQSKISVEIFKDGLSQNASWEGVIVSSDHGGKYD